jgi:cytochrome c-type biogenesis protein CcmE
MVADGQLDSSGNFIASEVLAKHDENYMPPAVSKSLAAGQAAVGADQASVDAAAAGTNAATSAPAAAMPGPR